MKTRSCFPQQTIPRPNRLQIAFYRRCTSHGGQNRIRSSFMSDKAPNWFSFYHYNSPSIEVPRLFFLRFFRKIVKIFGPTNARSRKLVRSLIACRNSAQTSGLSGITGPAGNHVSSWERNQIRVSSCFFARSAEMPNTVSECWATARTAGAGRYRGIRTHRAAKPIIRRKLG